MEETKAQATITGVPAKLKHTMTPLMKMLKRALGIIGIYWDFVRLRQKADVVIMRP